MKRDIDIHVDVYSHVVLSGGTTIFTVGVERRRDVEVLFQPCFQQQNPRHLFPDRDGMRRFHPQECVRRRQVAQRY